MLDADDFTIGCFRVRHRDTDSFGFSFERPVTQADGRTISPEDVLGSPEGGKIRTSSPQPWRSIFDSQGELVAVLAITGQDQRRPDGRDPSVEALVEAAAQVSEQLCFQVKLMLAAAAGGPQVADRGYDVYQPCCRPRGKIVWVGPVGRATMTRR